MFSRRSPYLFGTLNLARYRNELRVVEMEWQPREYSTRSELGIASCEDFRPFPIMLGNLLATFGVLSNPIIRNNHNSSTSSTNQQQTIVMWSLVTLVDLA